MPILFILIGLGISIFTLKYNKSKSFKKTYAIVFGFIFSGFALLFTLFTAPSAIKEYYETRDIYNNGEYKTIEGKIENFDPMPYSGHMHESFTLNGVSLDYSDFDESYYGFNNTASHGGPIKRNGQQVRLSYITHEDRNVILKVELK
ncbi:MAG: hypothetical protein COW63_02050 [Bacteroidetes bacterium CG18_big_fil_WC_8_21_14_2_50_41_14]|nr:MAG: hypothetical protein COW63_02050 [Bacteroidetes bacterium CG18_big_fil_WC_8_21_14_2_50_41_14]